MSHSQIGEFHHLFGHIIEMTKLDMHIAYSALFGILEEKVVNLTSHGQSDMFKQAIYILCVEKQSKR